MKEAFDSARAALRGGATEVTIVSLESFAEMPVLQTTQGHEEFEEAKREGVAFLPRRGPEALPRRRAARSRSSCAGVAVGLRRERPLRARATTTTTSLTLDADACVLAIGQKPDLSFLKPADGVELTPGGHDPRRPADARHLGRRASSPAATWPSARAT